MAEMRMRLKVGKLSFILYFMLNFVEVLASNKTTRHTHTQKGHATGCLFLKAGVCLATPLFFFPPFPRSVSLCCGCCACFMPFPSSWAAAAAAARTNISLHFNTLLLPRPRPTNTHTAHTRSPSMKQKATAVGQVEVFLCFPSLLGKTEAKKKLFLHNEFLRIFHLYEPGPGSLLAPQEIDSLYLCKISIFYFSFSPSHSPSPHSLVVVGSKSHRARLTMQIAGKYLGLWLMANCEQSDNSGSVRGVARTSLPISRN